MRRAARSAFGAWLAGPAPDGPGNFRPPADVPNPIKQDPKIGRVKFVPRTFRLTPAQPLKYLAVMHIAPHEPTRWSERLAFDVALRLEGSGEEIGEVLSRHELDVHTFQTISKDPVFLRQVGKFRDEIRDKGVTFRLKARTQAEELLKTSWLLIHSPDVSPAVKADLIKSTVKWAGLEPKNDSGPGDGGGGVRITINLGGQELGQATIVDSQADEPENSLEYAE